MKKETLEEAKDTAWNIYEHVEGHLYSTSFKNGFVNGAKWQQEQNKNLYSEEEVLELLQKALTHQDDGETGSLITAQGEIRTANFFSWFERFKKK